MVINFGDYLLNVDKVIEICKYTNTLNLKKIPEQQSIYIKCVDNIKYFKYVSEEEKNKAFNYIVQGIGKESELIIIPYKVISFGICL